MQWQDRGVILAVRRFGETSVKLDIFTPTHGRSAGLVRGGASKARKAQLDIGNIAEFTWQGRLSEQLGQLSVELIAQPAARAGYQPLPLAVINAAAALIMQCLAERSPESPLYYLLEQLLGELHAPPLALMSHYIQLELALLTACGVPLDTQQCVATGSVENLRYLSPKSGRAVCEEAGKPYHDRLFNLPDFIMDETAERCADTAQDVDDAFTITSHFLQHVASEMLHTTLTPSRSALLSVWAQVKAARV